MSVEVGYLNKQTQNNLKTNNTWKQHYIINCAVIYCLETQMWLYNGKGSLFLQYSEMSQPQPTTANHDNSG